jgi:hypothetical protein
LVATKLLVKRSAGSLANQLAERKARKSRAGRQFGDKQADFLAGKTLEATGRGQHVSEDFGQQRHKRIAPGKPEHWQGKGEPGGDKNPMRGASYGAANPKP